MTERAENSSDALALRYRVKLCCAQRWLVLAEEIVRNLRGLGYTAEAAGGQEACKALIEEVGTSSVPTLYVVCIHRSDQVVPLRHALLEFSSNGHPVIVRLLEPHLPLTMIAGIRATLEVLDHEPEHASVPNERRRWRQYRRSEESGAWRSGDEDAA